MPRRVRERALRPPPRRFSCGRGARRGRAPCGRRAAPGRPSEGFESPTLREPTTDRLAARRCRAGAMTIRFSSAGPPRRRRGRRRGWGARAGRSAAADVERFDARSRRVGDRRAPEHVAAPSRRRTTSQSSETAIASASGAATRRPRPGRSAASSTTSSPSDHRDVGAADRRVGARERGCRRRRGARSSRAVGRAGRRGPAADRRVGGRAARFTSASAPRRARDERDGRGGQRERVAEPEAAVEPGRSAISSVAADAAGRSAIGARATIGSARPTPKATPTASPTAGSPTASEIPPAPRRRR